MKQITLYLTCLMVALLNFATPVWGQENLDQDTPTLVDNQQPIILNDFDSISSNNEIHLEGLTQREIDPMRAMWLAAIFPGAGQIYNRKLWKLPIVYGGFLGLTYGISWNQRYFKGYSEAYRDLVENSPNKSYLDYVPPGYDVEANRSYLESAFKNKKDFYRRNRDLSVIGILGVYLIAILDAYVDASLYNFDISPNVSLNVEPAVVVDQNLIHTSKPLENTSVGLNWSVKF